MTRDFTISVRDWNPEVDQQISAQAQAMYETTLTRKHGLKRENFRDPSGMRLDARLQEYPGIPFGMVRGVQQRTEYVIPGTSIPTYKSKAASMERLLDQEHALYTRQSYEETLGSVRKAFYRVTKQPDGYYVWPLPPGESSPRKFKTEAEAVAHARMLSQSADPRLTRMWWKPAQAKSNSALSGRHGSGRAGGYTAKERASLPDSDFLKPETRGWPVSDKRHAEIALQYMAWGRGNRSEYPKLLRRLFELYPPSKNADLVEKAKRYGLASLLPKFTSITGAKENPMKNLPSSMDEENKVITARFPGKCAKCGGEFVPRVTEIVDSGIRGPQGGKKMMHAHPEECER